MSDKSLPYIDIVFDGQPSGPSSGRFVELEDHNGASRDLGIFVSERGHHRLRIFREAFGPTTLNPVSSIPKDGSYFLLFLASGYATTPMRVEVARYDPKYRPRHPWVNYANDSVFDAGGRESDFLGWLPIPSPPKEAEDDPAILFTNQWTCGCGTKNHELRATCRYCRKPKAVHI